jgi:hypothetical protein
MPITGISTSALARLVVTVMLFTLCGGRTALLAQAVSGRIQGVVVERASGQPVPGATLRSSGGDSMTTSDRNGRFLLMVTGGGPVSVQVEAPGYIKTERPGVPVGSDDTLRVELEPTPNFLERVQVTAAKDMQPVGDLATLADVVERSTIEARGDQTLTQAVANVPGLVVSGQAG